MIELTDQERRAINEYLGETWGEFQQMAEKYLTPEETEALGEKLEKQ
jgi:hypothetical protein